MPEGYIRAYCPLLREPSRGAPGRFHTLLGQAHIVAVANNVLLRLHNLYPDFRQEHDVENGDSGGSSKDLLNQGGRDAGEKFSWRCHLVNKQGDWQWAQWAVGEG